MMVTKEQDTQIHSAAVEFGISTFRDKIRPKGSVKLIEAEKVAESISANEQEKQVIISTFINKVDKILDVLRNEKPQPTMR
jgi:hypothetical protein